MPDILREKAIDLFVAGKRQHEVAKELNVDPRTLRRWNEDEAFVAALNKQYKITRELEQGERARLARQRREVQEKAVTRIGAVLDDTAAPLPLHALCLKLGMQDAQFDQRQFEAQSWRERVHTDHLNEKREKEAAEREMRIKLAQASQKLDATGRLFDAWKENRSGQFGGNAAEQPAAAQSRKRTPVSAPKPLTAPPPPVKPVSPIRHAPTERTKPDKSGHTAADSEPPSPQLALIEAECRALIREHYDHADGPSLLQNQTLVHALATSWTRRHAPPLPLRPMGKGADVSRAVSAHAG